MRNFNRLVAILAALLVGGTALAKEKPAEPKPKKVCRTEEMPGRITPKRICRIVPPREAAAQDNPAKTDQPRLSGDVHR
jgi:hypothetical protein